MNMNSDTFIGVVSVAPFWMILFTVLSFLWVIFVFIYFIDNHFCKNKDNDRFLYALKRRNDLQYINALKNRIDILEKMLVERENKINSIIEDFENKNDL